MNNKQAVVRHEWVAEIQKLIQSATHTKEMSNFIERIGSTIVGVKPACLVSIGSKECMKLCGTHFAVTESVGFVIVKKAQGRKQLFIYHRECIKTVFDNPENRRFLCALGYPETGEVDQYVRVLMRKIRSAQFPHEIGIFFGYPLKDVCGFMGAEIPYRKTMGWRMYGDTRISEKIYNQYRHARQSVRLMLQACQ